MNSPRGLKVFGASRAALRILRHITILALLESAMFQQCLAYRLHHVSTTGIYLTRNEEVLHALASHRTGSYWIDGYPMSVSEQTKICWHDSSMRFLAFLNWLGQPVPQINLESPCPSKAKINPEHAAWLQYSAAQEFQDVFKPQMSVAATRIDVWSGESEESYQLAPDGLPRKDWTALCATPAPHELRFPHEKPIDVVCDDKISSYVEHLASALQPPATPTSDTQNTQQTTFRFYVVRQFQVIDNYDFEAIDGFLGKCGRENNCIYKHPQARSFVDELVYAPDGSTLIPDTVLARLTNEAEFAALMSYSLAAIQQGLLTRLFHVQHFKGNGWTLNFNYNSSASLNAGWLGEFIWDVNKQVLRLGIRRMYLSHFDIRYAPYAWSVENKKSIKEPVDGPGKRMPWYAIYGFNDISQLYPNMDYSKLKRGEREYQAFKEELRKADPEAFAGAQPQAAK